MRNKKFFLFEKKQKKVYNKKKCIKTLDKVVSIRYNQFAKVNKKGE